MQSLAPHTMKARISTVNCHQPWIRLWCEDDRSRNGPAEQSGRKTIFDGVTFLPNIADVIRSSTGERWKRWKRWTAAENRRKDIVKPQSPHSIRQCRTQFLLNIDGLSRRRTPVMNTNGWRDFFILFMALWLLLDVAEEIISLGAAALLPGGNLNFTPLVELIS